MNTDAIGCNTVSALPEKDLPPGPIIRGGGCRKHKCVHQDKTDYFAVCGNVNSYYIDDTGIDDLTHLYCSQFDNSELEAECSTYGCTGNRGIGTPQPEWFDTDGKYDSYINVSDKPDELSISLVYNDNINNLRRMLSLELSARREHVFYSKSLESVSSMVDGISVVTKTGDNVDDIHQQQLKRTLQRIKRQIFLSGDYKSEDSFNTTADAVVEEDMIETKNLRDIENDLKNTWKDCICYADCNEFQLMSKRYCTCNINCMCNYG